MTEQSNQADESDHGTYDASVDARAARVGGRLRLQRLSLNLTIAQVAEAAGLTKGFLSRLERDQTSVSIAALLRICDVLNTTVGRLFEETQNPSLLRRGEAPVIDFGDGLSHELLTGAPVEQMRVFRVRLAPGGSAGPEEYALHAGIEFTHVLSGTIVLTLDRKEITLRRGDSMSFPGTVPHTYRNGSDQHRAEALWVVAPAPSAIRG